MKRKVPHRASFASSISPPSSRRALSPKKRHGTVLWYRNTVLLCLQRQSRWTIGISGLILFLLGWRIYIFISSIAGTNFPKERNDLIIPIPKEPFLKEVVRTLIIPQLPLFLRLWDSPSLRHTGNEALIKYAQEIRNLLLFAKNNHLLDGTDQDYYLSTSRNKRFFQQRLAQMAPWLPGNSTFSDWPLSQFPRQAKTGKAILICAGDKQMDYLETLLHTIRQIHKSNLPVYISYRGDNDLSPDKRDKLQSLFHLLTFLDLAIHFDLEVAQLEGWNLRPYGALLIPEPEVAILDADVLLLRPPEDLFHLQRYQDTGAYFFHDRVQMEWLWTPKHFLLRVQPQPSTQLSNALFLNGNNNRYNEHVMESGVVLLDKARRYLGLWAACLLLGRHDIRRFAQTNYIYGDKEMYIAGMEVMQEPYALSRYYPGVVGSVFTNFQTLELELEANSTKLADDAQFAQTMALCGRLLHFDDAGMPLWSNGGYITKEDDFSASHKSISKQGLHPLYYIDGGDSWTEQQQQQEQQQQIQQEQQQLGENQNWKFNFRMGVNCLFPNARSTQKVPLQDAQNGLNAVSYFLKN